MTTTNVAFLGLGAMGRPMAAHLVRAGHAVAIWNRTAERAATLAAETGARHAETPAAAARGARVVFTCLPVTRDVAALLEGDAGLLAGLSAGAVLVDCTSGDPAGSRAVAERLAARGASYLDAPVSGGVAGAVAGTLTVMAGGSAAALDEVRPVLAAFAKKVVHCGPVGAGAAVKAVNNALLAASLWSTLEGLAALTRAGVSPDLALDVINTSSGRSNASENLVPQRVVTRAFPRTFRLALLDKDVGIAAELLRQERVPAPLLQQVAELYRLAHAELGEEADHVEVARLIERWAGVTIAPFHPTA